MLRSKAEQRPGLSSDAAGEHFYSKPVLPDFSEMAVSRVWGGTGSWKVLRNPFRQSAQIAHRQALGNVPGSSTRSPPARPCCLLSTFCFYFEGER